LAKKYFGFDQTYLFLIFTVLYEIFVQVLYLKVHILFIEEKEKEEGRGEEWQERIERHI